MRYVPLAHCSPLSPSPCAIISENHWFCVCPAAKAWCFFSLFQHDFHRHKWLSPRPEVWWKPLGRTGKCLSSLGVEAMPGHAAWPDRATAGRCWVLRAQSLRRLNVPGCPQHVSPYSVTVRSWQLAGGEERAAMAHGPRPCCIPLGWMRRHVQVGEPDTAPSGQLLLGPAPEWTQQGWPGVRRHRGASPCPAAKGQCLLGMRLTSSPRWKQAHRAFSLALFAWPQCHIGAGDGA